MKIWASKDAIQEEIADVPENWLKGFALEHPLDIRKFAAKRNGTLLYRVAAVVAAIEDGEAMPNAGIVARGEDAPWMKDEDDGATQGAGLSPAHQDGRPGEARDARPGEARDGGEPRAAAKLVGAPTSAHGRKVAARDAKEPPTPDQIKAIVDKYRRPAA